MNPLTLVKRIQNINSKEATLGISEEASWHAKYKDSAYVFVGGIPFDLTEGDLLAVFAQYGEIVDVNLIRDKATGKSKGFAFLAYEDQRSTILAVDNLNGAQVLGRVIRVDHVTKYRKKEEEDEEKEQKKREERGVCRAFQKGECNRGASCRFSHDEQRCANTGWGSKYDDTQWDHDKYDGPPKSHRKYRNDFEGRLPEPAIHVKVSRFRLEDNDGVSGAEGDERKRRGEHIRSETNPRDHDRIAVDKQREWKEKERRHREDHNGQEIERRSREDESKSNPKDTYDMRGRDEKEKERRHREDHNGQEIERRSREDESKSNPRDTYDRRGRDEKEKEQRHREDHNGQEIERRSREDESRSNPRDTYDRRERDEKEKEWRQREDHNGQEIGRRSRENESKSNPRDTYDRRGRDEKRPRRHESEHGWKDERDEGGQKRSKYDR